MEDNNAKTRTDWCIVPLACVIQGAIVQLLQLKEESVFSNPFIYKSEDCVFNPFLIIADFKGPVRIKVSVSVGDLVLAKVEDVVGGVAEDCTIVWEDMTLDSGESITLSMRPYDYWVDTTIDKVKSNSVILLEFLQDFIAYRMWYETGAGNSVWVCREDLIGNYGYTWPYPKTFKCRASILDILPEYQTNFNNFEGEL